MDVLRFGQFGFKLLREGNIGNCHHHAVDHIAQCAVGHDPCREPATHGALTPTAVAPAGVSAWVTQSFFVRLRASLLILYPEQRCSPLS